MLGEKLVKKDNLVLAQPAKQTQDGPLVAAGRFRIELLGHFHLALSVNCNVFAADVP
jgi:hypothetical protein